MLSGFMGRTSDLPLAAMGALGWALVLMTCTACGKFAPEDDSDAAIYQP